MTIPNIITKIQKLQTESRLKLIYSQLNEALKLSEAENGDATGWSFGLYAADAFEKYLIKYMKVSNISSIPRVSYKEVSGSSENGLRIVNNTVKIYTMMNGTELMLYRFYGNSKILSIYIDLNGHTPPKKKSSW